MLTKQSLSPRIIRDITWAVGSPPLLLPPGDKRFPPQAWFSKQLDDLGDVLKQLATNNEARKELEDACTGLRLGGYFEQLIMWWIHHSNSYELLAYNLQVHHEGRTLGAFDILVRDLRDNAVEHWELACKFYIQDGCGDSLSHWYGPARNDVLIKKYRHLIDRQIALSQSAPGQKLLEQYGWRVDRHKIVVKGRLFGNFSKPLQLPAECNPNLLQGWIKTATGSLREVEQNQPLQRQHWMSEVLADDISESDPATAYRSGSLCVATMAYGKETSRGFLIPPDWFCSKT